MRKLFGYAVVLGIIAGPAALAHASQLYDMKIVNVVVTPGGTVKQGTPVTIKCEWNTSLVAKSGGTGYSSGVGTIWHSFNNVKNKLHSVNLPPPSPSAAMGTPFSAPPWTAKDAGQHIFECEVGFSDGSGLYKAKEPDYANNRKSAFVMVALKEGTWPASPSPGVTRKGAPGGEKAVPVPLQVPMPLPDLTVNAGYVIHQCAGGRFDLEITAWIKNLGPGDADLGDWTKPWVTGYPTEPVPGFIQPFQAGGKTVLKAGQSVETKFTMRLGPSKGGGSYDIIVQVDPQSAIKESNEGNNTSKVTSIPADWCGK